jgi:3-methyladenine DNA glycosylase AlkC
MYVCNNEHSFPAVISALLDSLNDKDQNVRRSVIESIERISKQNPEIVVQTAIYFWEMHKKVDIIRTERFHYILNYISCTLLLLFHKDFLGTHGILVERDVQCL